MPRKDQRALAPLAPGPLVKRARVHVVVGGLAHILLEHQLPVERVQHHVGSAGEEDLARHVVDARALDGAREREAAEEREPVEVPEEGDAVLRGGEDRAEGFGDGERGDGGFVAKEGRARVQFDGLAGGRVDRVDGDDAVFAGGDEGFGVGEGEGGDLADVEILKEAGGLGRGRLV